MSADSEAIQHAVRFFPGEAHPLHEDVAQGLHRSELLDQAPFPVSAGHMLEQSCLYGTPIRLTAGHYQGRQAKSLAQFADINHVEAGQSNALQHHQLQVVGVLAGRHQSHQLPRGVGTVPADAAHQDTVQAVPGEDGPNDPHIAPVVSRERGVVEADNIGEAAAARHRIDSEAFAGTQLRRLGYRLIHPAVYSPTLGRGTLHTVRCSHQRPVRMPSSMAAKARIECSEMVEAPVSPLPMLQPPATIAPTPMRTPPAR